MFQRFRGAQTLYHTVILTLALVLVVASVTDGVLHIVEFISMDGAPTLDQVSVASLQVLSPFVAAVVLLLLLGRDWGAALRAEEKAAAADERAAEALRRLDEAIESIDQGFALFDADDRLVRCNSRFRQMYAAASPVAAGATFEDLIRRSAARGHYADCDPRNPEAWLVERLRAHREADGPLEQRLSDGRWLRIDERRTADGGNVGLRTDITELKRRESDLAAKTAVLEATLGAMVQGVLVFDADHRLIAHNHRVQELLELPDAVLRPGVALEAFLTFLVERGEFGDGDPRALMRRRLEQLDLLRGSCLERLRPNGRVVEVRTIPVAGGLTLITYIDVTEQRVAEAQLRESEERFRKLSDSAMEGIIAHENGVIVDANRAAGDLLHMPAEQMIGRHLNDFISPDQHEAILARLARREESRVQLPCIRRDGVVITIEAQNRYVQHRGRQVSMVSFRDITEQQRAESVLRHAKEAAEQASRSKNDFVRTISHELRTPMNGVLGMLELLHDSNLAEPLRTFAATAHASADSMLGLLDDLLDFSKIEAGRLSLDNTLFDAGDSLTAAAEVVAARAAAKSLSLAVAIPAAVDCRMVADPARLRQIVLNLVGNAVKFTERGGVALHVETAELITADGHIAPALRFEVRDSGVGIPRDAQGKLFGEFVQLHDVAASSVGGTGLGLAISKRLVELMGGRIGVDSEHGVGSCFWFILPVGHVGEAALHGGGAASLHRGKISTADGGRGRADLFAHCRALVIDDAAVTRAALARQVGGWGATVTACNSMDDARKLLREDGARLSGLLVGAGVPADGAPPRGAAVVIMLCGARLRGVVIRPVGASIPALHSQTATLDWPAGPRQLLAALENGEGGEGRPVPVPPPPCAPAPPAYGSAGRVLLAEDSETNRMVASAFLERAGYEVVHAVNGREAVEMIEGMAFDLILMDVGMPEMDGLEATRRIRALPPPAGRTPIIALTADASASDRQRCLAAGMDDHLTKPLDRNQLLETVAHWANGGGNIGNGDAAAANGDSDGDAVLDTATLAQLERDLDAEMLSGLFRQFLDEAAGRIDRIATLTDDTATLRREAHTLKSTAATFGARRLSEAARALEAACTDDGPPPSMALRACLPALLNEAADACRRAGRLG